jgi:two-component system sensor histidine kinase GlrK
MPFFARILRPFSLAVIVLFGFALAVLPLAATLVSAVRAVERLAQTSQNTAAHVALLSRSSEMLREKLVDFERKAKRHLILGDSDSRAALERAYRDFRDVLAGLSGLAESFGLVGQISAVGTDAETLFQRFAVQRARAGSGRDSTAVPDRRQLSQADELFQELGGQVRELARAVSYAADAEVWALDTRADEVQRQLLLRATIWLPVSLMLVSLLSYLTLRAIRQLDLAIRRLGAGNLDRPIQFRGPRDLEYLGQRLDRLRTRLRTLEEGKQQFIRSSAMCPTN